MAEIVKIDTEILRSVSARLNNVADLLKNAEKEIHESTDLGSKAVRIPWKFSGKDQIFNRLYDVEKKIKKMKTANSDACRFLNKVASRWEEKEKELSSSTSSYQNIWSNTKNTIPKTCVTVSPTAGKLWQELDVSMRSKGTVMTSAASSNIKVTAGDCNNNGITVF